MKILKFVDQISYFNWNGQIQTGLLVSYFASFMRSFQQQVAEEVQFIPIRFCATMFKVPVFYAS